MEITADQVEKMSPDAASTAAGRKLASPTHWDSLGKNEDGIWGQCHGSAIYQIRVKFPELGYKCTCPSHKFPCKHILGILFMLAGKPDAIPNGQPPEWVAEWLKKKAASEARKELPKEEKKPKDPEAQEKRIEKREKSISEGLEQFELWLSDVIRTGLGSPQLESPGFWENQAARLTDYQAPGLASRLRAMSTIPGSRKDWPAKILEKLSRLALAVHAYRRLNELPQELQADVRQIIGWTYSQEEVASSGEHVKDNWIVAGQIEEYMDKLRSQRTWIIGENTGRSAYILQFAPAKVPFSEVFLTGACYSAEIVYWPSAYPMRAKFAERKASADPFKGKLAGHDTIASFLQSVSIGLSRLPWLEYSLCVIRQVAPVFIEKQGWYIQDKNKDILPLTSRDHWKLLALSGGNPINLAGEWDGYNLVPLLADAGNGKIEGI